MAIDAGIKRELSMRFIFLTISVIMVIVCAAGARADVPYPIVSYSCQKAANRIYLSYQVLWNEEGEHFVYSDKSGTYNPWDLVTLDEERALIVKTSKIIKSCALSTGTYKVVIEPNPGNYNLNGRCGAEMNAVVSVYHGKTFTLKPTAFVSDCFDDDQINEIIIQGTNGKVEIHRSSDPYKLHKAIKSSDITEIRELLRSGADLNQSDQNGETPLLLAVKARNVAICELLIQNGAKTDNALSHAAFDGAIDIVSLLLKYHANVNGESGEDSNGVPLVLASYAGNTEIVKLLIKNGANVNESGPRWYDVPAVVAAAKNGRYEVTKLLLKSGADINAVDNGSGATALMTAIKWSKVKTPGKEAEKVIKLLVDAGASTKIKDKTGRSALDYAKQSGDNEIVNLLKSHH